MQVKASGQFVRDSEGSKQWKEGRGRRVKPSLHGTVELWMKNHTLDEIPH